MQYRISSILTLLKPAIVGGLLALVAVPTATAEETFLDESAIERSLRKAFSTEPPDYGSIERFAKQLQDKTVQRQASDTGRIKFYSVAAMQIFGELGKPRYETWRNKFPESPTPILADLTARLMSTTGNLYSAFGSMSLWDAPQGVQNDLNSIRHELLHFKSVASRDPYWYSLMVEVCVASKCPRGDLADILNEGLKKFPDNMEMVIAASNHFLPKWSGDAAALEEWAMAITTKFSPANSEGAYAKIYWQAQTAQYGGQLFALSKVDWDRLVRGIRKNVALTQSVGTLNIGAALSCLAGARTLTREILLHPKFSFRGSYWHQLTTEYDAYPICRTWAGQQAVAPEPKSEKPVPTANP